MRFNVFDLEDDDDDDIFRFFRILGGVNMVVVVAATFVVEFSDVMDDTFRIARLGDMVVSMGGSSTTEMWH